MECLPDLIYVTLANGLNGSPLHFQNLTISALNPASPKCQADYERRDLPSLLYFTGPSISQSSSSSSSQQEGKERKMNGNETLYTNSYATRPANDATATAAAGCQTNGLTVTSATGINWCLSDDKQGI
jgi:hypothetical protein